MRKRSIALLAVLTIACLAASAAMWRRAFPLAGIEFAVPREEARAQMERFIEGLGHPLAGYRHAVTFAEDEDTKRFLELEFGLGELKARTRRGLNIWYWTARWFRPLQHEEFSAQFDPQGWLVGFSHTAEEERELPSLDAAQARALAEKFLREHVAHHPVSGLAFLEESHEQRPKRTDWSFTWERSDLRTGAARYRIQVGVQGDAIGHFREYLEVPDAWTRQFSEKREVNELCTALASYAMMPIAVGAFVLLVVYLRRHELDRHAMPWGWLAVFAAVQLGQELNGVPELLFGYATTEDWNAFVSKSVLSSAKSLLFLPLAFWMLVVLADAIYREQLPQHPPLRRALGAGALRDPHTVRALGIGIVLAAVAMAYVPGFYVVSQKLGAWCPIQVEYADALSGWFPWLESMSVGLYAAFGEELFFRVIGMLLLVKLLRWRWLAVVLACTTWAFLHSSYDQMPGYIRGIELTVEGVLWGWAVLRFGVVSTLTAHYLFNCWVGSVVVFQSASWLDKGGALAVSLWPVALFAAGCWGLARRTAPIADSEVAPAPPVPAAVTDSVADAPRWDFTPQHFSTRRRWLVIGASLAAMVALYISPAPQGQMLSLGKLELSRAQIAARGDDILRERGFAPETWRRVETLRTESTQARYLLRFGTLDQLADLFGVEWPEVVWEVRYFRIGEREQMRVALDKHGRLVNWQHWIPDEAPGPRLDRDAALALATATMERERGFDPAREGLISESPSERENRRDHYFEFQRQGWNWGDTELRTAVRVQGDEVWDFSRWVKIPEAAQRELAKSGWRQLIAQELRQWIRIGMFAGFTALFVVLIRRHQVPWRRGFIYALFPLTLTLIGKANDLPWFFSGYSTTTPLPHFLIKELGGGAVGIALGYLGNVLRISVALGLVAWTFGWTPRAFAQAVAADGGARRLWSDAVPLVLATIAVLWGESMIQTTAIGHWLPWRGVYFSTPPVHHALPWLGSLLSALGAGFSTVLSTAITASLAALAFRRFPRLTVLAVTLYPFLGALDAETLGVFIYQSLTGLLSIAITALLLITVWRFNPVIIFLAYTARAMLGATTIFLLKGGPTYRWDGFALIVVVLSFSAAVFWFSRRGAREDRSLA